MGINHAESPGIAPDFGAFFGYHAKNTPKIKMKNSYLPKYQQNRNLSRAPSGNRTRTALKATGF